MNVRAVSRAFALMALVVIPGLPAAGEVAKATAPLGSVFPVMTFPDNRISLIEAVRLTLLHDPNLRLAEQQAVAAKGIAQTASGPFDPLLVANASYSDLKTPLTPSPFTASTDSESKTAVAGLSLAFPFRDGVTAGVVADGGWTSNRLVGGDQSVVTANPDVYNAEVGFTLDAALLRGRGVEATGAAEKAARINWEASELSYRHAASTSVLNTIAAYWSLVGAQEQLQIAKKTLALSARNAEVTRALIAGDEIPRAELSRVLASQAADQGQVAAAERAVTEARVALAIAVGLSVPEVANAPLASDPFPVPEKPALLAAGPGDLIAAALDRRLDRKAALKLMEAGGVLLASARTGLRPKLDFHGRITAATVGASSLSNAGSDWTFPSFAASLAFEKPLGNHAARGQVLQQEAAWNQQTIGAADLERVIKAAVVRITRSLGEAAEQVARAQEATTFYARTVDDENEKYRGGQSTLIDTITTRQLGTSADLAYTAALEQWALLVAQLRFETGTLVDEEAGRSVVRKESLLSLPAPGAAK